MIESDRLCNPLLMREIDLSSSENNRPRPTYISLADRMCRAMDMQAVDQRCTSAATLVGSAVLSLGMHTRRWKSERHDVVELPELGKWIRHKWAPVESRSSKSKAIALVHAPKLAAALQAGSAPAAQAVLEQLAQESYSDTSDAVGDDSGGSGGRLVGVLVGLGALAAALVTSVADNADQTTEDGDPVAAGNATDVAASVADDVASQGANAGVLDTAEQTGQKVQFVLDSDDACSACQDAHDNGPYDPDDAPDCPVHIHCACWLEPEVSA